MSSTIERKYAMVRVRAGDYILPSNNARQLWRIYSYDEDGTAEVSDGKGGWRPVTGTFWGTARYDRPFHNQGEWTDPDFLDWDNWLNWESGLPTRRAAVESALRAAEKIAAEREP